jgi:hypothetical protein
LHEIPARRGERLVVFEKPHFEAHAARADVRHAQPALHGVGKRDGLEITAAVFDDEIDDRIVREVASHGVGQIRGDSRVDERIVRRVVEMVVEIVVHETRGDREEMGVAVAPVGCLSFHAHAAAFSINMASP